ncbi:ABC transporter permease [Mailhella massiliensis]|uniref:ABC transporter permease n=1 Tax=Mailhella massiliensis TaxID=1903261 RepID=A0A921AW23_9BACT|nr:ABC transporter permease [Mailhella massiliensis]HJD96899.1 ABC transporter permease [Mailhella massiliensis]
MQPTFDIRKQPGELIVSVSGSWTGNTSGPSSCEELTARALAALEGDVRSVRLLAPELEGWGSPLLAAFYAVAREASARGVEVDASALPEGMAPMLDMALAVPPRDTGVKKKETGFLEMVGDKCLAWPGITADVVNFIGETAQSMGRFFTGRASCSSRDMWAVFRECGVDALPIVTLTSLLLGLILAFVSSMQLKLFGAEIYVASLVGVSMVRVMGPVLTGIVLSGRTGASFAAVIGSMQVNEEVDALTGFGISPTDFLVLPRVLGMALMTPLLTLYADVAGMAGGFLVGVLMLGISPASYLSNTLEFMSLSYVWIGLLHAFVFGFIISLCGCYQGIRCGRNASAVGRATTAAVVSSIVGIIVATSVITIIFTVLDL